MVLSKTLERKRSYPHRRSAEEVNETGWGKFWRDKEAILQYIGGKPKAIGPSISKPALGRWGCSSSRWWQNPHLCMGANFGKSCRGKQLQSKREDMELGRRSVQRWVEGNGTQIILQRW